MGNVRQETWEAKSGQSLIEAVYDLTANWRISLDIHQIIFAQIVDHLLLESGDKEEGEALRFSFNPDGAPLAAPNDIAEKIQEASAKFLVSIRDGDNVYAYHVLPLIAIETDEVGKLRNLEFHVPWWITRNKRYLPALDIRRLKRFRSAAELLLSTDAYGRTPKGLEEPVKIKGPPPEEWLKEHRGPDDE